MSTQAARHRRRPESSRRCGSRSPSTPASKWEYGINIDWVGRLVEEVSGQDARCRIPRAHLRAARHGRYRVRPRPNSASRQVSVHQRRPMAGSCRNRCETPTTRNSLPAAAACIRRPRLPDLSAHAAQRRQLQRRPRPKAGNRGADEPEPDRRPAGRHDDDLHAGAANNVDFFPGAKVRWGLGYMLNMEPGPNGRSAGTRKLGRHLQQLLLA